MNLKCYYCVVRYVPSTLRNESVNLGVILEDREGQPGNKLFKFVESFQRAGRLDPERKGALLERAIRPALERIAFEADNKDLLLDKIAANFGGGKVQLTAPRLLMTPDPKEAFRKLYKQLVVDEKEERQRGVSEATLRREVRDTFSQYGLLTRQLKYGTPQRPLLVKGKKASYEFDFQVRVNGFLDLMRCISFDVEDFPEKINSAKVLVFDAKDVREEWGKANIISILQPPTKHPDHERLSAFRSAREILQDQGIMAVDFASKPERTKLLELVDRHVSHAK